VTATLAIEDMMQEAKNNSRKAFVAGANEKVKDRLAKFGVEGIIETRKEALENIPNLLFLKGKTFQEELNDIPESVKINFQTFPSITSAESRILLYNKNIL